MERVNYLYLYLFLLIFLDSSDSYRDVICPTNETIGQQNTVNVLQIGEHAWTVFIEIKTYHKDFDEFQPEGKEKQFYCSGSLLKPFLVLTSASCLNTHISRKRKSKVVGVYVFGDYNRSEIAEFMKVPKKYPTDGRRDPQESEYYCQISAKHQPRSYRKRYIYYYNNAKKYKKSDPDIALIGLKESIIFNSTRKITVPIARPCHDIDYESCLITQLKDRDHGRFEYKCKVTVKNKTINDGYMEQGYEKQFGKLDCFPKTSEQTTYIGGNPIVCRLKENDPEKYVQIGILQLKGTDYKYVYLPDIINF